MRALTYGLVLGLAGCGLAAPSPYAVTDEELQESGAWTAADARARELIGAAQGALGYRSVRLVPWGRKFWSLKAAVETVVGFNYETPYYYARDARAYVAPQRDGPPVILEEEWQAEEGAEVASAPARVFTRLRRQLAEQLRELLDEPAAEESPAAEEKPRPLVEP